MIYGVWMNGETLRGGYIEFCTEFMYSMAGE